MDTIQELQRLQSDLIQEIDIRIEQAIRRPQTTQAEASGASRASRTERAYEHLLPLTANAAIFKGKRPTGVIFADGTRMDVPTWKKVFEVILKRCNADSNKHDQLMSLRGRILGRNRVLLGSERGSMRSPVQIGTALYAETHYDTETLLKILTTRILNAVEFDYSRIVIAVQNDD